MSFRHEQRTAAGAWMLVADDARARILSQSEKAPDKLEVFEDMEHSDSRLHTYELVSDQPGYFKGRDGSLDAGDPKTDFKRRTAQRFASKIVHELQSGRQHSEFGHLVLVAAPMFPGVLKSHLRTPWNRFVERSIDKEYTAMSCGEIATRHQLDC